MCKVCLYIIKKKVLNIRIIQDILNKLRLYAAENEKTMTQVISNFIDSLRLKDDKLEEKHQLTTVEFAVGNSPPVKSEIITGDPLPNLVG